MVGERLIKSKRWVWCNVSAFLCYNTLESQISHHIHISTQRCWNYCWPIVCILSESSQTHKRSQPRCLCSSVRLQFSFCYWVPLSARALLTVYHFSPPSPSHIHSLEIWDKKHMTCLDQWHMLNIFFLQFWCFKDGKILKEWVSQNWVNLHLPNVSTWPEIGVLVPYQIKLWELNNLNKYTLP